MVSVYEVENPPSKIADSHGREMAVGNTFGATALSSYGGFWIAVAIILTPGGFQIEATLTADGADPFLNSFGLFLMVGISFISIEGLGG